MNNNRPIVPSDSLAFLRNLESSLSWGDVHQVRLVIDTNVILRDLRWLLKGRTDPAARTALQEVIASETVIAFAPDSLRFEVQEKIPGIALDLGVGEEQLQEVWKVYETALHFYSAKSLVDIDAQSTRDPDDLPFVRLYQLVGAAAVYTLDKDVPAMGAPAITPEVVLSLRDYARAASVELTIKVGGAIVLIAGIETIRSLVDVLKALGTRFPRLAKQVQYTVLIMSVIALVHPNNQKRIMDALETVPGRVIDSVIGLTPAVVKLAEVFMVARISAEKSWGLFEESLQTPNRLPVRVRAFAVCLAADKPLSEVEIEGKMQQAGHKSKSRNFPTYLRKVLRRDARFIEAPAGYWSVHRAA